MMSRTVVPTHSMYGVPANEFTTLMPAGCEPAPPGGMPFADPREGFCKANENSCGARSLKDGDLCVGHQKSADKATA